MAQANPTTAAPASIVPASSHTRLIEVVDALVKRTGGEPWGVRELAAELDESRSTINRILLTLVERDFALEVGVGKYTLGPRVNVLTHALSEASLLLRSDALTELANNTESTALVSIFCPLGNGYFVSACAEAKASLTFRPELGTLYPLTFGDIGRQFSAFIASTDCNPDGLNTIADPGSDVVPLKPGRDSGMFSESEFPQPQCVTIKRLANGLLIAVSVHSVTGVVPRQNDNLDASVLQVCEAIAESVDERLRKQDFIEPNIRTEDTKSTVARLERLVLLACAYPDGFKTSVGLHDQLLCNEATAKRLIESGLKSGIVMSSNAVLYPGPKLIQWAAKIGYRSNIADLARSTVQHLVQETGETIALLSYDQASRRAEFLDVIQGWRPIQYQLAIHSEVPLYAGAAGKAVLAYCDQHVVESIELLKITDATITDRDELVAELGSICERGWATGTGERVTGAFGLAVPFFVDGKIRGSISATIPQYRKDDRDLPRLTQLMREATLKIERLLSLGIVFEPKS